MTLQEAIKQERESIKRVSEMLEDSLTEGTRFSWQYAMASEYKNCKSKLLGFGFTDTQAERIFGNAVKRYAKKTASKIKTRAKK